MAAAAILDYKIFNGRNVQEGQTASLYQISSKSHETRPRYCDFSIFQDGGGRHLKFSKFQIFNTGTVKRLELHHYAKFRWNRPNRGRDIEIYRFFKMAVAAILDFQNFEFLTNGRVTSDELRHCAKFRRNRSKRGRDMYVLILC